MIIVFVGSSAGSAVVEARFFDVEYDLELL